jgi:predicted metal-dependent phosphoesterase TrpH
VAVRRRIAHPGRYAFSPTAEYALFTEFIAHGGRGVEVVTGAHSQAEQQKYAAMALELDMLASRGSDFHAPTRATPSSARCPTCPGACTPVWMALRERAIRA